VTDDPQAFQRDAAALSALDRLEVANLESLHRQELTAAHLYRGFADRVPQPEVARALRDNAAEELGHARRVRRMLVILLGADHVPAPTLDEPYPIEIPDEVDEALLAAVIAGERGGEADYRRWAEHETDPEVARLLLVSAREEAGHAERLERALGRSTAST
jgi:rubrerythrin